MKPLSRLLPPENILLDFQATSKKRVFEHIGLLFENNQGIGQRVVFDSLLARERLDSTGGAITFPLPAVLGHEVTSTIVEVGPSNEHTGLEVGQNIAGGFVRRPRRLGCSG